MAVYMKGGGDALTGGVYMTEAMDGWCIYAGTGDTPYGSFVGGGPPVPYVAVKDCSTGLETDLELRPSFMIRVVV